jgi:ornithine cyclodeaminase/alanine dehydrogenase-like protein (mu-crystallin family)
MEEALFVVENSLRHRAAGRATNRPRERVVGGPDVQVNTMLAADYELGIHGFKTYTVASGVYRFFVYLYDSESGDLLAIIEANRMGQLRTGAATGVATNLMARSDATEVGIIGSGSQAPTQLEAVCQVRNIQRVRVHSATPANRERFAVEMSRRLGVEVAPVETSRQAVEGADIVVTITDSREPVLNGAWLSPGMHVAAAGGADPYIRELDDEAVQRADLIVVDDLAQTKIEAGELMMPASRGLVLWEQMRELWQVVSGEVSGRESDDDITLFKSLGMALWDIAAAKAVYDKAVASGKGKPLGDVS